MAKACCNKEYSVAHRHPQIQELRDYFEQQVLLQIPGVSITAKESLRLPNTSSLVIHQVDGEVLLLSLDLRGFAVSTGAACSSGNPEPSPVLLHMGLTREEAQNSLRVSLGWETTKQQVDLFLQVLKSSVERLRALPQDKISKSSFGDLHA
jgi:cysteine desulfurase